MSQEALEAVKLLDQVGAAVSLNRIDHMKVHAAVVLLNNFIIENTPAEGEVIADGNTEEV